MNINKIEDNILPITLIVVVITGLFYWYELRPIKIKQDCSWVNVHEDAKPATSGITQEEAEESKKKCLTKCEQEKNTICWCKLMNFRYKPQMPERPAKDYWQRASDREYKLCVRDKGL